MGERMETQGYKKVVVKIPKPRFVSGETLRERHHRQKIQKAVYGAITDPESIFRRVLCHHHGEDLVDLIQRLFEAEGVDCPEAESFFFKIVTEFMTWSHQAMFLHYLEADDFDRAVVSYAFWPFHRRFLEITTQADGDPIDLKCPHMAEEFDFLCEEMGIAYRAKRSASVIPKPCYQKEIEKIKVQIPDGSGPKKLKMEGDSP